MSLTFDRLRRANLRRAFDMSPDGVDVWDNSKWACALAGEVGELCNKIKKGYRGFSGEAPTRAALAGELADIVTYADLLAAKLGIDLGVAVCAKFNEVSQRPAIASPVRLDD